MAKHQLLAPTGNKKPSAEGGTHQPCCFTALSESFLIFLSILTLCVIALFTPFVLTGLFCDSDVTPSFQANDRRCAHCLDLRIAAGRLRDGVSLDYFPMPLLPPVTSAIFPPRAYP